MLGKCKVGNSNSDKKLIQSEAKSITWAKRGYFRQLPIFTCLGHLPFNSTRIKSCAAAAADFQHPLKVIQVVSRNVRHSGACEKLAGQVFR